MSGLPPISVNKMAELALFQARQIGVTVGHQWLAEGQTIAVDFDGVIGHAVVPVADIAKLQTLRWYLSDRLGVAGIPPEEALHLEAEQVLIEEEVIINPLIVAAFEGMRQASGDAPVLFSAMPESRLKLIAHAASYHPMAHGLFKALLDTDMKGWNEGRINEAVEQAIEAGRIITQDQTYATLSRLLREFRAKLEDPSYSFSIFPGTDFETISQWLEGLDPAENPLKWEPKNPNERDLQVVLTETGSLTWKPRSVLPYDLLMDDFSANAALAVSYPEDPVIALQPEASIEGGWGLCFSNTEKVAIQRRISQGFPRLILALERVIGLSPGRRLNYPISRKEGVDRDLRLDATPLTIRYDGRQAQRQYFSLTRQLQEEIRLTRGALQRRAEQSGITELHTRQKLLEILENNDSYQKNGENIPIVPKAVKKNAIELLRPKDGADPRPPKNVDELEKMVRVARFMTNEARKNYMALVTVWGDQGMIAALANGNQRRARSGIGALLHTAKTVFAKVATGAGKLQEALVGVTSEHLKKKLFSWKGLLEVVKHPIGSVSVVLTQVPLLKWLATPMIQAHATEFALLQVLPDLATRAYDHFLEEARLPEETKQKFLARRPEDHLKIRAATAALIKDFPQDVVTIFKIIKKHVKSFEEAWKILDGNFQKRIVSLLGSHFRSLVGDVVERREVNGLLPPEFEKSDDLYRYGYHFLHELLLLAGGEQTALGQLFRQALIAWDTTGPQQAFSSLVKLPRRLGIYLGRKGSSGLPSSLGLVSSNEALHRDFKKLGEKLIQGNEDEVEAILTRVAQEIKRTYSKKEEAKEMFEDFLLATSADCPDERYPLLQKAATTAYAATFTEKD